MVRHRTAAISATSGWAVVAERAGKNRDRLGISLRLVGSSGLAKQEKRLGRIDAGGRPIDIRQKLVVLVHT